MRREGTMTRAAALRSALLGSLAGAAVAGPPALAADALTFGTNWKAEAEHGGFYQAVASGLYKKHGLDVTIRQGGPQVNHSQLLAAGRIDMSMGGNLFEQFNFAQNGVPVVTVAAFFQKEPQVIIAHPGVTGFEDLKNKTLFVGTDGRLTYWLWLKGTYGLSDDQLRPYTFSAAPFLADKNSAQQGYVTSEPYAIEKEGGFEPVVLSMADHGYDTYATTLEVGRELVETRPDIVQRFVDASAEGWYSYLYGDPSPGNALIKADNPEMSDEQIAFSIKTMKDAGIVDSGEALTGGIGVMTEARWRSFYAKAVSWGLYPPDLPLERMMTLRFVNHGAGLPLKKQLAGG